MQVPSDELTTYLKKAIFIGIVVTAFFLPLFFLPQTAEFFQFNKQMFLAFATFILTLLWTVLMVLNKRLAFVRSVFDLPLLLFFLAFLLASIFAESRTTALFGLMGRFDGSLPSLFIFLIFFYVASANLTSFLGAKIVLLASSLSTALAAALGVAYYFGYFLPLPYAQFQTFTPVGSPSALALLAALQAPILTAFFLYEEKVDLKVLESASLFVCLLILVLFNIPAAWLALAVGLLLVVFFERQALFLANGQALLLGVFLPLTVLAILNFLPPLREGLPFLNTNFPPQQDLSLDYSWQVAADTIRTRPLFGVGPGSFLTVFSRFRPVDLNNTDLWNIRFLRAGSYYLELLATTGIVGLLTFLFLAAVFFKALSKEVAGAVSLRKPLAGRRNARQGLRAALFSTALAFLFSLILSPTTLPTLFFFFLVMAATAALTAQREGVGETVVSLSLVTNPLKSLTLERADLHESRKGDEILPWVAFGLTAVLSLGALWQGGKIYAAEINFRNALVSLSQNRNIDAYNELITAVSNHPRSDLYRRAYSQLNLALAGAFAQAPDDPTAQQTALQLISQAVREANLVTQINPYNVLNWENRAAIYRALVGTAQSADQFAIDSYDQAIRFDPINPELRVSLGGLYFSQKNWRLAAAAFADAVRLKPDHANARFNLALTLKEAGDLQEARSQLQLVLRIIPNGEDNADYKTVKGVLGEVEKALGVPGAKAAAAGEVSAAAEGVPSVPSASSAPATSLKAASPSASPRELIEESISEAEEATTSNLPR